MDRKEITDLESRVRRARQIEADIQTHEKLLENLGSILPQQAFTFSVDGVFRVLFPTDCGLRREERDSTALVKDRNGCTVIWLTAAEAGVIVQSVVDAVRERVECSEIKLRKDLEAV